MVFSRNVRFALPFIPGLAHCCNALAADAPAADKKPLIEPSADPVLFIGPAAHGVSFSRRIQP